MFRDARLKLTAWYLLIIMLVSVSFSAVIYRVLTHEFERFAQVQRFRIEGEFPLPGRPFPPIADIDLVAETKRRLFLTLLIVNGGIFVVAGGLGFFLAGRTLKPIQEMLDEQNRFISDSSHELRTPLTSLKSTMEVGLRDKQLTLKDAKRLMIDNLKEVDKMQSLTDGLLQLAQYDQPNGHSKFEKLSLVEIIGEALHRTESLAKKKGIAIKTNIRNLSLEGNKYGLTDLLVILLDNAIKYSPEKKTVTVFSQKNDGMIKIEVKDKGIGIEEKDIPYLFDRFYRADLARAKVEAGGYGLGLSIAKKIVDLHHGSIKVTSQLGVGSTFSVYLPAKQRFNEKSA